MDSEECVALNKCSSNLDHSYAPTNQTRECGLDKNQNLVKICCSSDAIDEAKVFWDIVDNIFTT